MINCGVENYFAVLEFSVALSLVMILVANRW